MRGHHVAYTLAFLPARHRLARASLNAHCGAGGFAWRAADGELYGRSIALLRPCRERPCGRRAAEQRDELAAPDAKCHLIPPAGVSKVPLPDSCTTANDVKKLQYLLRSSTAVFNVMQSRRSEEHTSELQSLTNI